MEIEVSELDGVSCIAIRGRLDSATSPVLRDRLLALLPESGGRVVVGLTHVAYVSSAGFRVLLIAARAAEAAGGAFALHGLSAEVRRLFEIASFTDFFTLCDGVDAAAEAVRTAAVRRASAG